MAETPEHPHDPPPPLRSEFADDPDMADLVELFVSDIPSRLGDLRCAWESGDLARLRRLAHQLSGSCAGYGFPTLGSAARELEDRLLALDDHTAEVQLRDMAREYQELIDLCSRACGERAQP